MQMWTGEETSSLTQQGISNGLQAAGVSKEKANTTAALADASITIIATAGAAPKPTLQLPVVRVVQQVGKPASSTVLAENMIATGASRPANTAAHHIVAGGHTNLYAQMSRQILQKAGVDINLASNGVFLPKNLSYAQAPATTHSVVHTNVYFENVYNRLSSIPLNKVADELVKIGTELKAGTFAH